MSKESDVNLAIITSPNRTLGPARSLAERTLADLRGRESSAVAILGLHDPRLADPASAPVLAAVIEALQDLIDNRYSGRGFSAMLFEVDPGGHYYMVCEFGDSAWIVVAMASHDHPEDGHLSPEQLSAMARLGWGKPEPDENYQRFLPLHAPVRDVAELMLGFGG